MRQIGKRCVHALQDEARFDKRQIERLAVVGHDAGRAGGKLRDRLEQRALGAEIRQEELPQAECGAVEPAAPDEEGIRTGAAGKASRFKIEEKKLSESIWRPVTASAKAAAVRRSFTRRRKGRSTTEEMESRPDAGVRRKAIREGDATVPIAGRVLTIDHEKPLSAELAPFAPEDFGGVMLMTVVIRTL